MTQLPEAFISYTRQLMGEERFERYMKAFEEETPVSIRLNPKKASPNPSHWRGAEALIGTPSTAESCRENLQQLESIFIMVKRL